MPAFDIVAGLDTTELNAVIAQFYQTLYPNLLTDVIAINDLGIATVKIDVKAPPTASLTPAPLASQHLTELMAAQTGQLARVLTLPAETQATLIGAAAAATFTLNAPQVAITISYESGQPSTVVEASATLEVTVGTQAVSSGTVLTLSALAGTVSVPSDPDLTSIINSGLMDTLLDWVNANVLKPFTIPVLQYQSLTVSAPVPVIQQGYALAFSALGTAAADVPSPFAWPTGKLFFGADAALVEAGINTQLPAGPKDSFSWHIVSGTIGATIGPLGAGGVTINGDGSLTVQAPCQAEAQLSVNLGPLGSHSFGPTATATITATGTPSVAGNELSIILDSIGAPTFQFSWDGLPNWIAELIGLDALADALGAALAPLVTLFLKGKSFSVVKIPSENITLAGTAYTISVSQVNVSSIQGPNGRLLLVTFQPTFGPA